MTAIRQHRSIRTRLALIYSGLLAAGLLAFGAAVFLVLRDEVLSTFDAGLAANVEHAAGAFSQDVDAVGRLRPSERLVEQLASTGGRVIVLGVGGNTLADSAPPGTTLPPLADADLDLDLEDDHPRRVSEFMTADGDRRRFIVEPIVPVTGSPVGFVVWADSTQSEDELLRTVGVALVLGGALVAGLALGAGLILARRALAPVADVTETARAISLSEDFAARVDGAHRGDEVGELAVAFNEMLEALEQNHQALQTFLGDASHQLRTPLTTIRANLDLAQRSELPQAERQAILADARDEAERMGRLIGDLLSLARADSGARLEFQPVELDALLVETVRIQRMAASHVRMSVSSVLPAIVDGDRDRLRELIGILLDNAARYTPAGGNVIAALEVLDGRAVVRIEDTGIGLQATDRDRLFERLYRGSVARAMRPSGTGLGLAIARWIADSHAGTIELTDRPGGGTVATVSLPVQPT